MVAEEENEVGMFHFHCSVTWRDRHAFDNPVDDFCLPSCLCRCFFRRGLTICSIDRTDTDVSIERSRKTRCSDSTDVRHDALRS